MAARGREAVGCGARRPAVDDLIALVAGVDGLLQVQATADAHYFASACGRRLSGTGAGEDRFAAACRPIGGSTSCPGAQEPRFADILDELVTPAQMQRVGAALTPLVESTRWAS